MSTFVTLNNIIWLITVKKHLIHILLSCCFILLTETLECKTAFQYGLTFNSYEVEKEQRTSLNLTPKAAFTFSDGFVLEFDMSLKKIRQNYGYVFRVVGSNNEHIDFLLSNTKDRLIEPRLAVIYKASQLLCNPTFEELNIGFDQWIKIKLVVNTKAGQIKLKINEKEFEKTEDYFNSLNKVKIVFGKNDLLSFETSDVPSMSIKDIRINKINGSPLFYWRLAQHINEGVYDEVERRFASCKDPKWILDSHAYWQLDTTFVTNIYPQITFNRKKNQLAVADRKAFYVYDLDTHTFTKDTLEYGIPRGHKSNQLSYNSVDDKYFTYDFINEIAFYAPTTKAWNNTTVNIESPNYWHHNRYFSEADTTLYTIGGYGFLTYKNDILKYRFNSKVWERGEYKGDVITPRYLSGLGVLDEKTILIFGGYGSEKGAQELSPHNYYDLYSYNIETAVSKKLWELDAKQHNFVVANSMVVDTVNKCFYALCFPHQKFNSTLQIYRFSIEEPTFEILADSIPYQFNDIHSFADLYLSDDGEQLIAVTSYTHEKDSKANVAVYRLAYTPLNKIQLLQDRIQTDHSTLLYIVITLLLLSLLLLFVFRRRKKQMPVQEEPLEVEKNVAEIEEEEIYDPILGIKPLHDKSYRRSILLFGGFQVIDKDSNKITGEFTPTLKQLFLLILLYTLKDGKGISSVKLREILWFDKTNESAKNNRGVSLSKLRSIFEKIGKISINSANSYWIVEFDEEIYCDYYEALILMDRLTKEANLKDINRLVSIVSAGELLPNLETEWVDSFKSDFSNRLIDLLLNLIDHSSDLNLSSSVMINIADAIFAHDSLNEDALKIKCTLLVEMGKNGLAQKVYSSFIKEYQSLFGVDFKYTFEQVVA